MIEPTYKPGRLVVFRNTYLVKKRPRRVWQWWDVRDRQRVVRDPIIVFIRRVA